MYYKMFTKLALIAFLFYCGLQFCSFATKHAEQPVGWKRNQFQTAKGPVGRNRIHRNGHLERQRNELDKKQRNYGIIYSVNNSSKTLAACVACPVAPPCTCSGSGSLVINCTLIANNEAIVELPKISNIPTCLPVEEFDITVSSGTLRLPSKAFQNLTNIVSSGFEIDISVPNLVSADDTFARISISDLSISVVIEGRFVVFDQLDVLSIGVYGIQLINFTGSAYIPNVDVEEMEGQQILWPPNGGSIRELSVQLFNSYLQVNITVLHLTFFYLYCGDNASLGNNVAESLKSFNGSQVDTLQLYNFFDPSIANFPFSTYFPLLTDFAMEGNNFATLEPGCQIEKLTNLQSMDLSWNNITSIKSNVFTKLQSLEVLYLGYNPITTVEENAFLNMRSLSIDSLGYNVDESAIAVSSIGAGAFTNISSLDITLATNIDINIDAFREVVDEVTITFTGNMTISPSKTMYPPRSTAMVTLQCRDSLTNNCASVCPEITKQFCAIFQNRQYYNLCPYVMNYCG